MHAIRLIAPPLSIALLLGACAAPGPSGSATATQTISLSPEDTATLEPSPAPTAPPTIDPAVFTGGAGLSLSTSDGLWQVGVDGGLHLMVDAGSARLSPDSRRVAYLQPDPTTQADDVWLLDLSTGETSNLTQTPDRYETVPSWWPGRPDVIVFGSDTAFGMENSDYPTVVNTDGSGYQVLDQGQGGPRALSPDGTSIAYGAYDVPGAIYTWGAGAEPFNPADYGVDATKLIQPAYAPDGSQLAWIVAGGDAAAGDNFIGLAVFDLAAHTGKVFHSYQPIGGGSVPFDTVWSPDGTWIAFTTFGEPPSTGRAGNIWVIRPDGSGETYVGEGVNPVWSPDGSQLAYLRTGSDGNQEVWLAPSSSWQPAQLQLPERANRTGFLMGWTTPN